MTRICIILGVILTCLAGSASAAYLDIGPHVRTWDGKARGYWFESPVDFMLTGLRVPQDASVDPQHVQVLKLNVEPPVFSASTSDFSTLFYATGIAGNDFISMNIPIMTGDIVGILGVRGEDVNSYGQQSYETTIDGFAITLDRLVYQGTLVNNQATAVSREDQDIGRIEMEYNGSGWAIPEPSALVIWSLLGLGVIGIRWRRRCRA